MRLFICYTPLQALIAKKIIMNTNISEFYFIYFYDVTSEKNSYYFNLLAQKARYAFYTKRTKKLLQDAINIYKIFRQLKTMHASTDISIYAGNIKSIHTRLLLLLIGSYKLYTFDDGFANIAHSGFYHSNKEKILFKLFFLLFNRSLIYKNLREQILIHYSIFREKNIYQNVKYINLFDPIDQLPSTPKPVKTILLTSVLAEERIVDKSTEKNLYASIIDHFHVTHVIPHPKEYNTQVIDNVVIINSELIAEDIILKLSKTYELTVIGIFSSTLLNLSSMKIVKNLITIDYPKSKITQEMIKLFQAHKIVCYRKENHKIKKIKPL